MKFLRWLWKPISVGCWHCFFDGCENLHHAIGVCCKCGMIRADVDPGGI